MFSLLCGACASRIFRDPYRLGYLSLKTQSVTARRMAELKLRAVRPIEPDCETIESLLASHERRLRIPSLKKIEERLGGKYQQTERGGNTYRPFSPSNKQFQTARSIADSETAIWCHKPRT